jgi:dUTP pyrophosphatase
MNDDLNLDPQLLNQLKSLFEQLKEETDDSIEGSAINVEDLLNMKFDDLEEDLINQMNKQRLVITRIHDDAVLPKYAYPTDSGFDLHSVEEVIVPPLNRALIPTGIKINIPQGFEIQVRPKSGLAINFGLTVLNTPGTVDQGYTGEIKVIVFNTNQTEFKITKNMKIAQAVLCPVVCGKNVVIVEDEVEEGDRGEKGFGSTGV